MYLELYERDGASMKDDAFRYLVMDLLQSQNYGESKGRTITALDNEASINRFIPSVFYTFLYVKENGEMLNPGTFVDVAPVILCTSVSPTEVSGINFNLIPNKGRASILDILYDNFKGGERGDGVSNEMGFILSSLKELNALLSFIKAKTGLNITNACRKYSRKFIHRARVIENDMLQYIPALDFNNSIRGMNLKQAQKQTIR